MTVRLQITCRTVIWGKTDATVLHSSGGTVVKRLNEVDGPSFVGSSTGDPRTDFCKWSCGQFFILELANLNF